MEQNILTPKQVVQFQKGKVGNYIMISRERFKIHLSKYSETPCEKCHFTDNGKMGANCPKLSNQSNPVCFARNRDDNESVYFRKI